MLPDKEKALLKRLIGAYAGLEKLAPRVRDIGWTHNLVILQRCKAPLSGNSTCA